MQAHFQTSHRNPGLSAPGDVITNSIYGFDEAAAKIAAVLPPSFPQAAVEAMTLIAYVLTDYGSGYPVPLSENGQESIQLFEEVTNNWGMIPCPLGDETGTASCFETPTGIRLRRFASEQEGLQAFADAYTANVPSLAAQTTSLQAASANFYSAVAPAWGGINAVPFLAEMQKAYLQWQGEGHVFELQPQDDVVGPDVPGPISGPFSTLELGEALEKNWPFDARMSDEQRFGQGLLGFALATSNNGYVNGVQTNNPGHLGVAARADGSCEPGFVADPGFKMCIEDFSTLPAGIKAWYDVVMGSPQLVAALNSGDIGQLAYAMIKSGVYGTGFDVKENWTGVAFSLQTAIDKAVADIQATGDPTYLTKWSASNWVPPELSGTAPPVVCSQTEMYDAGSGSCVPAYVPPTTIRECPEGQIWDEASATCKAKGMSTTSMVLIGTGLAGAAGLAWWAWPKAGKAGKAKK